MTGTRGALLLEYRPPRAHPIVYAAILVFAVVFLTGSLENLLRGARPELFLYYALPLVGILFLYAMLYPCSVRIHEEGIRPSRPLVLRWRSPFVRWDDLGAVYPCFYDVTGAFVSPFASSDGKVTQMGLALERPDGRAETVRFTPTRFEMGRHRSAGYDAALTAVRHAFARRGRPLTPEAPRYSPEERARMLEEAGRPFLPFIAIVLLFACSAPLLALLVWIGVPLPAALPVSLLPPASVAARSVVQSRRRNALLNAVAKSVEYERHTLGASA